MREEALRKAAMSVRIDGAASVETFEEAEMVRRFLLRDVQLDTAITGRQGIWQIVAGRYLTHEESITALSHLKEPSTEDSSLSEIIEKAKVLSEKLTETTTQVERLLDRFLISDQLLNEAHAALLQFRLDPPEEALIERITVFLAREVPK